jgi:N-acetylmuramoyl-L-alanine amidase
LVFWGIRPAQCRAFFKTMTGLKDIILHLLRLLAQILTAIRGQKSALQEEQPQAEQVDTTETVPVTSPIPDPEPEPPVIVAHRITTARYVPTVNQSSHEIEPRYLLTHYTANGGMQDTIDWFRNEKSNASAHLIIGRDGELVQMVDFNRKAWHAGESRWGDTWALNECSIGVELVNWGPLTMRNGLLIPWTRNESDAVDISDAIQLRRTKDGKLMWWQRYTDEQLEVYFNVAREVFRNYDLIDSLGHEDVSGFRGKQDPGPAFPLRQLLEFCFSDVPFRDKDGKTILQWQE